MVAIPLLTAARARDVLSRHGLATKKSLGQHFLVDPNTVDVIVALAKLEPGDRVLEIGPGIGALTAGLLNAGANVHALEVDKSVLPALRDFLGHGIDSQFTCTIADALTADIGALLDGPTKLVANLPYNVGTQIIIRILTEVPLITEGLVMVQKEVGARLTAKPGSKVYGIPSVKVAACADATVVRDISPSVFFPPPKVTSSLVSFTRKEGEIPTRVFRIVDAAFAHRRKTLVNSMSNFGYEAERVSKALAAIGIDGRSRAESLSLADFVALAGNL